MGGRHLFRLVGTAVALLLLHLAPAVANAQTSTARRFEITNAADTTFTFSVRDQSWVKAKMSGIAVDPRQRDAVVARFEVMRVQNGIATAVITGATSRVTTDHIAQLSEPPRRWWKSGGTWIGLLLGVVAGVAVGSAM
jgi:hypothetical protein